MTIAKPVGNPGQEHYPVTSGFGWRIHPVENTRLMHFGIDIPAPSGTNVRSAESGIVITSRLSPTAGNYIGIQHPNGFITKYMHLLVRHVNVGDTVRAGDIIGNVGMTGTATGNHLHFEMVDAGGNRIDPINCYRKSKDVVPYDIEGINDTGIPNWLWWVGGGTLLLTAVIVVGATRNEEK